MNSFSSYFANLEIRKNQYQVCSIGLVSLFLFNWSFGIIIKQWIFRKYTINPGVVGVCWSYGEGVLLW